MHKVSAIILISYYLLGSLCLPMGNFSTLPDLLCMYRHCKATEDKDMTPFDFITDHLINIDCIFDKHDNGDEQKPHVPQPANHQLHAQIFCSMIFSNYSFDKLLFPQKPFNHFKKDFYHFDFITSVFRPPVL